MRQMTRIVGRFFVLGVLASVLASACNGGGDGQSGVLIVVDGKGLTQAQLASVTDVWIYIDGDGDGSRMQYDFKVMGLAAGTYQYKYRPQNHTGKLTITGELHAKTAAADTIIATNLTIVDIRMGNQVMATIMLSGTTGAGGAGGTAGALGGATGTAGAGGGAGTAGTGGVGGAGGNGAAGGVSGAGAGGAAAAMGGGGGSGGAGTCAGVTACSLQTADGCCPGFCTGATDVDCAICGNGVVEQGEACDPLTSCPSTCAPKACQLFSVADAGTCRAACVAAGLQTHCTSGDGCCPSGCTTATDTDCQPGCGNGALDGAETCDIAPAGVLCAAITCDDKNACTVDSRLGADSTCNVSCAHSQITGCTAGARDGCCAPGCNATNDPDCAVVCGNSVVEAPTESCDTGLAGSCPTSCPQSACVLPDLVNAGTCKAACVDQGRRQTSCILAAKDGCCPGGCNANNDADCTAVCGNGVLEPGESCESTPATPTCAGLSCDDKNACTTDTTTGSARTCDLKCVNSAITTCVDGDGCCAPGCTGLNDSDCAPPNDTCANAVDVTAGGDFPFSLFNAKTDFGATSSLKCGLGAGGDVFFTFTLPTNPTGAAPPQYYTYADVFDANGNSVNVALELYAGTCQTANPGNPATCAASGSGMTACGSTNPWPRMTATVTAGAQYILIARMATTTGGRYTLRFHRVPTICASAGAFPAAGTTVASAGCNTTGGQFAFSCAATVAAQQNYYLFKCPASGLSVETCYRQNEFLDTALQVNRGSVNYNTSTGQCTVTSTVMQVCNDTNSSCTWSTTDATLTGVEKGERGLFTVNVGSSTNPNCSSVMLGSPAP